MLLMYCFRSEGLDGEFKIGEMKVWKLEEGTVGELNVLQPEKLLGVTVGKAESDKSGEIILYI